MTTISEYYIPGLHVSDCSIHVPLDWTGHTPGQGFDGESLSLFYRVLSAPERVHQDLPLLVFLQGGPGGSGPRPLNVNDEAWIAQAVKHFHVILPDQRGTGRSSHVNPARIAAMSGADGAAYLKKFLADSIIRDFEHLRRTEFAGRTWVTLGQSYGDFLTLTYLSLCPHAVSASFTTGGIPHVPANAHELYEHTFNKMEHKSREFYKRYAMDAERIDVICRKLEAEPTTLPNGDVLSVERLQTLGQNFGMKPAFERMHWLLDTAFIGGDGSAHEDLPFTQEFLQGVESMTNSHPLYWPLQEFIYANGELDEPINWAAQHVYESRPAFSTNVRPLMFTGEAIFEWMFEQERDLKPFRASVETLMQDTHFGTIYDAEQLANNEVPLNAAVYFDDMYVPAELSLDTLAHIGNEHHWVTNEYEHDGIHGGHVFRYLFEQALERGDLAQALAS